MAVGQQYGILTVKNNDQLIAEEQAAAAEKDAAQSYEPVISDLAAHCMKEWQRARDAKQPIEREMLQALRQRQGKYDDQKLAAIRETGGSEIKMMLTDVKCRTAEAWLRDILFGTGERPFSLGPTPIPDIPKQFQETIEREAYQELMMVSRMIPNPKDLRERIEAYKDEVLHRARQMAKVQAKRMEDKVDDDYLQGNFYEALDATIQDFVESKAGIIKGPVIRNSKELQWANGQNPTKPNALKPVVTNKLRRHFYAVSPFDLYLSPEARHVQEGTVIERHRMGPDVLSGLRKVPSFDAKRIEQALEDYGNSGYKDWLWHDSERSRLEGRPYEHLYDSGNQLDVLECWTKVRGQWLIDWGMTEIPDPNEYYDACLWLIGKHVIRATLNDDPLGIRPYHMDSFVKVRNSPWGRGVPDIINDLQNMCDACARALSNNMGIASGPQAEVFVDRLPEGEQITKMYPWKIWQTTSNKFGTPGPAVNWFQPDSNAQVLIGVFEFFSNLADEYTGIPKYQQGETIGGAGRTAAGLSMLMNASGRTMKGTVKNLDNIIIGTTKQTHRAIMLYDDEMENKGDVVVIAKASQALMHREAQQMRLIETLDSTNNPTDFQLMGPRGRLELLRAALRGLDAVDIDKVLPTSDQEIIAAMSQQLAPPPGQQQQQDPNDPNVSEPVEGMA